MGASLRALRALLVLAGFYLLGFVVLGALVAADFAVAEWVPGPVKLKPFLLSFLLAIPVVKGMFMLRTPAYDGPEGLPVGEDRQPELWRTVREVAELTGIRGPDEIVLTGEWRGSEELADGFAARAAAGAPKGSLLTAMPPISWFEHRRADANRAAFSPRS